LMHADVEEIAITEGCSAASNIAVDLIEPTSGGNVVFDEFTYPSSIYPWLLPPRDQLEKRFVKPRDGLILLEDVANAVDDKTIAVSVTHVSPFEGFKHDIAALAQIAHAHGAVLLVDGSQAAGAMEIDLHETGVDFYATCAMKWLFGAAGVGFLYVAKKHLEKTPSRAGYISAGGFNVHDFNLVPSAERLELGMPNMMGLAYTRPGLEILLEIGLDEVERHVLELTGYCLAGLKDIGLNIVTPEAPEHRLGCIAAWLEEAQDLNRFLLARGVDTCALSVKTSIPYPGDVIRADPHIYNNRQDVDRLLEGVDAFYAKG
ncbi:MAG: aminotransferase class V-fold PLP-dependent enzyme, partial [Deltaproteobacteria bacterium]|nr:aminotransferase class V-fold PLP-dependent enzyme [Deltaproteobacteria bacterium]